MFYSYFIISSHLMTFYLMSFIPHTLSSQIEAAVCACDAANDKHTHRNAVKGLAFSTNTGILKHKCVQKWASSVSLPIYPYLSHIQTKVFVQQYVDLKLLIHHCLIYRRRSCCEFKHDNMCSAVRHAVISRLVLSL